MVDQKARERAYVLSALDAMLLWLAFILAFWIRLLAPEIISGRASPIDLSVHLWSVLVAIPIVIALAASEGLYGANRSRSHARTVFVVARIFVTLGLVLGLAIFLFQAKSFSRAVFALFMTLGFALISAEKLALETMASRLGERAADVRQVLIVGVGAEGREICRKLTAERELGIRVVGHVTGPEEQPPGPGACHPQPGGGGARAADATMASGGHATEPMGDLSDLRRIVSEQVVDEVVFALPVANLRECEEQISWCEEVGVTVHLTMDLVRTLLYRTYPTELQGTPMLTLSSTPRDPAALALKRGLDVVISAAGIVVLSPVMLLCGCAVALTSRGPVFFTQKRVGMNGRLFTLYKLRSMYEGAERRKEELASQNEMTGPVFKMRDDPRITPVGRWLRKFSLDEVPQLWNVLKGDLSLVGPRPPTPDEVARYERWQRRRLSVKPGVTCLWQVSGRNGIDFADWMKLDLRYIDTWSLKLDLKILLRTIPAVLFARGSR